MIDFAWKLFSQTGNVETYLLLKELEKEPNVKGQLQQHEEELSHLDTKL
ncbi:YqzL family protein [Lentibacillus daqui]|nr:YqzL family protein [Lentibacillus daqui]